MAYVSLSNITVLNNPTAFTNPFQFEVTFECMHVLDDDLEWKITYVGSANDEHHDQILEEVLVGPVPVGTNKFVFQAKSPDFDLIPHNDQIGVTIVLVTCSYRDKEFIRVGYYVNNEYIDENYMAAMAASSANSLMNKNPESGTMEQSGALAQPVLPAVIDRTKIRRNILADKPRFTRFPIEWGDLSTEDNKMQLLGAKKMDEQHTDGMGMMDMDMGNSQQSSSSVNSLMGNNNGNDQENDETMNSENVMLRMAHALEEDEDEEDGQDYLVVHGHGQSEGEDIDLEDDLMDDEDEENSEEDENEMDLDEIDLEDEEDL